jgi:hypothetical protein
VAAGVLWLSAVAAAVAPRGDAQPATTQPATWTLSARPVRVIGEAATSSEWYSRIVSVAVGGSGEIILWDPTVPGVRVHPAGSGAPRLLARSGAGPGEIRAATWIGVSHDTIFIVDATLRRITRRSLDGRVVSTSALHPGTDVRNPRPVGRLADGRMVWQGTDPAFEGAHDGVRRDTVPIAISAADGAGLRTIARAPGATSFTARTASGGVYLGPLPFGPTTHVEVAGTLVWTIDSDTPVLRALTASGQVARSVRVPFERVPVTAATRAAAMRRELEATPNAAVRALVQRKYAAAPTESPYVTGLAVAPNGDVWLTAFVPRPDQPARVAVFTESGALRATLTLPPRLRIVALVHDTVVAVHRDADDVETVHVYAVQRAP